MTSLDLTPPTDTETLIVGALGNLLTQWRLVEKARLVVTVREPVITDGKTVQVIDLAIIPIGKRKHWLCPRYGAKFEAWLITWRVNIDTLTDMPINVIMDVATDIARHAWEQVQP